MAVVLAANVKPRSAEQKISFGDQQREDEETLLVSVVVSCSLPRVVWWGGKGRAENSFEYGSPRVLQLTSLVWLNGVHSWSILACTGLWYHNLLLNLLCPLETGWQALFAHVTV